VGGNKKKTVLIVDDAADLREALRSDFQRDGYEVLEASDGREGFKVFKSNKVDIVISDVRMPHADGISLLNLMKRSSPEIPVIMLINDQTDLSVEDAYNQGAEVLFSKPFDRKALKSAVKIALAPRPKSWKKRASERHEVSLTIVLDFPGTNAKGSTHKLLNIGRGGMFVSAKSDRLPYVGDVVDFSLKIPEGPPLNINGSGVVRWTRTDEKPKLPVGFGLEFSSFEGRSRGMFMELINAIKTTAYIPKK
jgi:CheY-like chemotaxis protein